MTIASVFKKLSGLNWVGGAFRLWLVLTVCWEAFVLFHIFTGQSDGILFLFFAMLWPVLFLAFVMVSIKAVAWVLLGFKGRDEKIDGFIQKIDRAITAKNVSAFVKEAGGAVLSRSTKILFFLVSVCVLVVAIMVIDLSVYTVTNIISPEAHENVYKIVHENDQISGVYKVQAPDGKIVTLQGPENASENDIIAQAKTLYKNDASSRYQISFPAAFIFSIGILMLFRRIITGGSNTALFRIAVAYLFVLAFDAALARFSLNPFYPEISLQVVFLVGLVGFIVLSPLKKALSEKAA